MKRTILFFFSIVTSLHLLAQTTDMTWTIDNPNFDGSVSGWTVDMPSAQNKGYQKAGYSNGSIQISLFAEAWISSGRYLSTGSILQTIEDLPEGDYTLEADMIATDQKGSCKPATGVNLVAESATSYSTAVDTENGKPEHFTLDFHHSGNSLTIGLRTLSGCRANWVAIDNVRLTYKGVFQTADISSLVINEIQVSNLDLFIDPSYNYGGWVEVYNPSSSPVPIRSLYVSDDPNDLTKFQLSTAAGAVAAGGYKNIWFDHNGSEGNYGGKSQDNVNFKLNAEGGTIYLSDGFNVLSQTYPPAVPRCSYMRNALGVWGMTGTPTPEQSNASAGFATERLATPVVSRDGGLFDSGQTVTFTVDIPQGCTLRYTTDGSTPTESSAQSTTGNFTVSATSVYRFRLFRSGYLPSPVATRSFIYKNHDYYLPVISITTHPGNLFDSEIGIYTQGTNGTPGNGRDDNCNWNRDWERPVNVECMEPLSDKSYTTRINQEVDMEIAGGWTRAYGGGTTDGKKWEMKGSFRLKCDKRYEGMKSFDFPVFPNKPHNKYKVWQVRNGGNDTKARIIDPAINQIVLQSGIYIDAQDARPSHIFFNGQYLGMFNIRESNNRHYGDSNYGIDTDDMDQFDLSNCIYNQKVGTDEAWVELVELARQLATDKKADTYAQVCERLDIDEYINYMALEAWLGCGDWLANTNNIKGFRSRSDGKFHFVLFDTDSHGTRNTLSDYISDQTFGATVQDLIYYLLQYDPFKKQFITAMCLVDGSVFEPTRCSEIITAYYNTINTALGYEGNSSNKNLISSLSSKYNGSPITNLRNAFSLPQGYRLTLSGNVPGARLQVNGQEVPTGKFSGYLFNYNSEGIQLSAKAPAGYTFLGWKYANGQTSMTSTTLVPYASRWDYYDQGSLDNEAWKTADASYWTTGGKSGQAPFGYANDGKFMLTTANTRIDYGTNSSQKRPTYYFHTTINLDAAPGANDVYTFNYKVDDGVMLHVNGQEIGGYYVTSGSKYADYTTGGHYEGDNPYEGSIVVPNSVLKKGTNHFCIEVHNCSGTSSDIYFDGQIVRQSPSDVSYVSTQEHFSLTDALSVGTYTLEAIYAKVDDERDRLEQGAAPIRINEVSAGNDIYLNDHYKKEDWVELYNTTDEDIDIEGLYLSDNARKGQKYQITGNGVASTIVPAHGHLIVWADQMQPLSQLHAPFKLSNADGAVVSIQAEDGTWADHLQYLAQPRWHTYGRYPDGGNYHDLLAQPTIAKANKMGTQAYNDVDQNTWLGDEMAITIELSKGWNWTSHNLRETIDKTRITGYAQFIKGQTTESVLDPVLGWQGCLNTLDAAQGYKVQMTQAADITLRGHLYDVLQPVHLQQGWNWLGLPLYNATALETALQNYGPSEGDMIVGQTAFATYEGGKWTGGLTTLHPGQAYMLKTGTEQDLMWNSLAQVRQRQRRYPALQSPVDSPWEVDIHACPNVMGVIAQTDQDDILAIAAFAGAECRGVAEVIDGQYHLAIHGFGGEALTFRAITTEGDVLEAQQHLSFAPLALEGSGTAPYLLSFGQTDQVQTIVTEGRVVLRQYFSLSGQPLAQPQGICIERVTYENGKTVAHKHILP